MSEEISEETEVLDPTVEFEAEPERSPSSIAEKRVPKERKIKADGADLSFVTIKITDKDGVMVPNADNLVNFQLTGDGLIAGVDNGSETSHEPFKANYRKAFNGLCLAVIQSKEKAGTITLKATSEGLEPASVEIMAK